MSQKPRTGPQARSASGPRIVSDNTQTAKAAPVAQEPVAPELVAPELVAPELVAPELVAREPVTENPIQASESVSEPVSATPEPAPVTTETVSEPAEATIEAAESLSETVNDLTTESAAKASEAMSEFSEAAAEPAAIAAETTKEVAAESMATTADTTSEVVEAAVESAEHVTETIKEEITAAADTIATVAAEVVEPIAATRTTKPTPLQGMKIMMKSTEDFVAFGQANLEAFVKSGQIWSAGVQELTKQFASTAKASFDESVSTFKAISTAKSVKEAIELQSTFAKSALEKAMTESNKLTDASIKLTEQTLAPITARVTVAVETFGKAA